MSLGLFGQIGNILSGRYGKDKEIEISAFLRVESSVLFEVW